jgi:hypothetical protein
MSELTKCNRCTLDRMQRDATVRGVTVILGTDEYGWVSARYSDQDEPSAHFMELTDRCAC